MPLGFHRKDNRSKPALNDPSTSSTPQSEFASATDETTPSQSQSQGQYSQNSAPLSNPITPTQEYGAGVQVTRDHGSYQQQQHTVPARSQSTRHNNSPYSPQGPYQAANSVDDLRQQVQQQEHQSHQRQPPVQKAPVEHRKSRNFFDRMRPSRQPEQKPTTTTTSHPQAAAAYNNTTGLSRRPSKRQETLPALRTQQRNSLETQQRLDWQATHAADSRSTLPSPQEAAEDNSGLDPYLKKAPEQDFPQTSIAELGTYQTTVPNSDPLHIPKTDEARQHNSQAHSLHNSLGLVQQQPQFELPPQHRYHQPTYQQQLGTNPDSLGLLHNPYQQRNQNPETVSQISYESPIDQGREEQTRPVSQQSNNGLSGGNTPVRQDYPNRTTSKGPPPRPLSQYNPIMAPQPTGASQSGRRNETKQTLQGGQAPSDSRAEAALPGYQPRGFPSGGNSTPTAGPGQSPIPPVVGTNPQGPNYRGGPPQREPTIYSGGGGDQGRSTPPPNAPQERDGEMYKELLQKYKKVKGLYFDKTAQVEQLQNTLANQRLSQSRTSLDDSEYMTRFQRLDGATTNLAFNIRKEWRNIPVWLTPYVNQDALKIGKQEMTAVGRACISRFLIDEIFNRSFHPCLDVELSTHLKTIEQNIRWFSPALNNTEEVDALTAKVVSWRLATLEGLKDVLFSPESEACRREFASVATSNLTAILINYLGEPAPPGIQESAHMIVELAVGVAANLPLESRDISIIYPMPGDLFQPDIMRVETGVPLLENAMDAGSEADAASTESGDRDEPSKEGEKDTNKLRKEKPAKGMLQAMMGGGQPAQKSKPAQVSQEPEAKKVDAPQKVRFAGFVGVEVRGRQVLGKAPVWTV
ncbi:hypothetical protein BJ878DRAFT_414479 [Calycina marina]|uniref:Uncharacterized protein n=1 Tax=Calycina marina TaxID=1763456 RepID=A0A9P8CI66_9HELO|nr:hypothetical protein BJ878DRAFT_414479 [Calycina marina]